MGLKIRSNRCSLEQTITLVVFLTFSFCGSGTAYDSSSQSPDQMSLYAVLGKVKQYCQRLENGAYDFVCLEEISEKIEYSRFLFIPLVTHNRYVYDYQLIKKGSEAKETRILLEKNGNKTRQENASLETNVFRHQFVLLRTADLFNEFGDYINEYRIIGQDILYGEEAVILEAAPKGAYQQKFLYGTEPSYLCGKIWVKKKDYSILKIIWNPKVIRDFANIEERAIKLKAEPQITIITEYSVEKNGIRFPSRLFIEEAYINKKGKKFVRSQTEIIYEKYRFFTVETEVKY